MTPRLSGDAVLAAVLLAVDPSGLGGVSLRARTGPWRDEWLARAAALHPGAAPWRKVPANVDDATLLGGLDPVAILSAGRPVIRQGLLAAADGGLLVISMAERLGRAAVGHVSSVLDLGEVRMERDGASRAHSGPAGRDRARRGRGRGRVHRAGTAGPAGVSPGSRRVAGCRCRGCPLGGRRADRGRPGPARAGAGGGRDARVAVARPRCCWVSTRCAPVALR